MGSKRTHLNLIRHYQEPKDLFEAIDVVIRERWPADKPFKPDDPSSAGMLYNYLTLLCREMPIFLPGTCLDQRLAGRLAGLSVCLYEFLLPAAYGAGLGASICSEITAEFIAYLLFDGGYDLVGDYRCFEGDLHRDLPKACTETIKTTIGARFRHYLSL